jgi:hypothetical protein
MKVGDLVVVHPAKHGTFIIVKQLVDTSGTSPDGKDLWEIWNTESHWASPMAEKWIEVISEGR